MPPAVWRAILLALTLAGGVLAPAVVQAQAGFYLTPVLSVAEIYDDNIFATASHRQADFISRFSPEIQAGYRSPRLMVSGRYTFDAETYARHPELNDAQVRQTASLDLRYAPTPALTVSTEVAYAETQTPGELNVETGLAAGRVRAYRLSFSPSIAYRFDPRTAGTGGYSLTKDEVAGGISTLTHTLNLGLDRRITRRDTGHFTYQLRQSAFEEAGATTSHAFTLGWTRELTPRTSLTLRAGPRFTDGSTDPELSASVRQRFAQGDLSLTYARSQTTVLGQAGTATTDTWSAMGAYRPLRFLEIRGGPTFLRSTRAGAVAEVLRVSLDASYKITQWLALVGSYQFSLQRGSLDARNAGEDILQNVFLLRLVATSPSLLE